jgi:hypothetical protein
VLESAGCQQVRHTLQLSHENHQRTVRESNDSRIANPDITKVKEKVPQFLSPHAIHTSAMAAMANVA